MPKLLNVNTMQTVTLGAGNFQFSGIRPENLGATEYTLVTIVVDTTSSAFDFKDDLLNAVKAAIATCRQTRRKPCTPSTPRALSPKNAALMRRQCSSFVWMR